MVGRFLEDVVHLFNVGDADFIRVFCRRPAFVTTDDRADYVALTELNRCRRWRLDEGDFLAPCYSPYLGGVYPVHTWVNVASTESLFPDLILEL